MIKHVEEYAIAGSTYGIEDYKQGKKSAHFFPDMPHKRFRCWVNGCGIGGDGRDSIEEAREYLRLYAIEGLAEEVAALSSRLSICQDALRLLENDPLASFQDTK